MKKRPKHARRKVTQEQVDAMNRELELTNTDYRYSIDPTNGRLTKDKIVGYYNW